MPTNWPLARRKNALHLRARLLQETRKFFLERGYLEVETPHRIPAPAPECHIDAVPSGPWVLHASPELCMKRLLAAGYEKIFQICRCWREGERGSLHLPEFTLLEWYRAGWDYEGLMRDCEALLGSIAEGTGRGRVLTFRGQTIDLSAPWQRISVQEAFRVHGPLSMERAMEQDLFDEIMIRDIEPRLGVGKPTFLCDYPAERAALARLKPGQPSLGERFELYLAGVEVANAFSELVDSKEQRVRFERENEARKRAGKATYALPERFLAELEEMPPSAGIAMGFDRLVVIFGDLRSIDDGVAFTAEEL